MITIRLNDETMTISRDSSLAEVLAAKGYTEPSYAVALNRSFVPRTLFAATTLNENDLIEIITPMQGG